MSESYTRSKYHLLVVGNIVLFLNGMAIFCVNPVFPSKGMEHGLSKVQIGLLMAVSNYFASMGGPLSAKFGSYISVMASYNIGAILMGLSIGCFGWIDLLSSNTNVFFTWVLLLRAATGVAESLILISMMTKIMDTFPNQRGLVIGTSETSLASGLIFGSALSIQLVSKFTFYLPYLIIGSLHLIMIPIANCFASRAQREYVKLDSDTRMVPIGTLLTKPLVMLPIISNFFANFALGSLYALTEYRAQQLDLSPTIYTTFFVIYGLTTLIFRPLGGMCCDADPPTPIYWNLFFDSGGIIGFLLIGPISQLWDGGRDWFFISSTVFFGLLNCCLIATCSRAQNGVGLSGLPMNEKISQRVQSLWATLFFLGLGMGSHVSGYLISVMSFNNIMITNAAIALVAFFIDLFALCISTKGRT
ncbi:MFS-type transporter SLC18B1-like [Tigriopus californicus]|uniref:MFS-type transporter SLC18B1-like n=1 Tax=Tigriopus californicus TaxID=6832 RepID=UPI0027DA5C1D|nr:MFS-type transporter SLC18B1-like [Tigriopus californicus]